MQNFYDMDIIPIILKAFKVNNVVVSGVKDNNLINAISTYSNKFIQNKSSNFPI